MKKQAVWIIRFAVAIIALIIICAVIQPMIDAQIAQESIELAAEQMSIDGSQEYTVYHGIMQVCYWAARIAQIGVCVYMGFCLYQLIHKKGDNE